MKVFYENPDLNPDDFYEAYKHRDQADWDKIYENFDAAVDWPTVTFYKDLLLRYPEAKVLLTVRSAESWYKSAKNTIHKASMASMNAPADHPVARLRNMSSVVLDGLIANEELFSDEEKIKQIYLDHIEDVKKNVPAQQLLIMELGEGWTRLCNFLGKEIPNEPYPNSNSTEAFEKVFESFKNKPNENPFGKKATE